MTASLLIAEDHHAARELIADALEGEGYDLTFAESGTEALERIRSERFDAALLDVMLPGPSGIELCRRLKGGNEPVSIPVILMSGALSGHELDEESSRAGADAVLPKPFSLPELRAVLRAFVRIHEQSMEIARLHAELAVTRATSPGGGNVAQKLDWSLPYRDFMKHARKEYLMRALSVSRGNKSLLARQSGLDRSTLYVHFRNLGMIPERKKTGPEENGR